MPDPHALLLLLVTVGAFYLYTRPWIRTALVSLLLLLTLLLIFYLFPYTGERARLTDIEIFESFGHPALVAICCLMILARGLTETGAIEPVVRLLGRVWQVNRWLGLLLTLIVAGSASAFINDTPVLVLMLPMLLGLAARTGYPASKTLMPVNLAILCGGMLTSIGTSTNVLVLNIAQDLGMAGVGLFDFTPIALIGFAIAIPYLWLVAPHLLPDTGHDSGQSSRLFEARVRVEAGNSRLEGRKLPELSKTLGRSVPLFGLLRDDRSLPADEIGALKPGDALLLRDTPAGLRELAEAFGATLFERGGVGGFIETDSARADTTLAEVVVGSDSELNGRTLRDVRFADQHQVVVVGLSLGGGGLLPTVGDISQTKLSVGDVLLVQAPEDRIARLRGRRDLLLLDASLTVARSPLATTALGIMAGVLVLAASQALPIHVAAFLGVMAMLVTGCIRFEQVGRALSLEVVLLIASSVALGGSLVATGAASWVAGGIAALVEHVPPSGQLAIFMGFAALLTNFVSNAAAASVGTPIAVATASALGLSVEPFVLAILFGANLSFATPMAYQTNVLIMNAARYRFVDFVKVGLPLVAIMLSVLSYLLARYYGL